MDVQNQQYEKKLKAFGRLYKLFFGRLHCECLEDHHHHLLLVLTNLQDEIIAINFVTFGHMDGLDLATNRRLNSHLHFHG